MPHSAARVLVVEDEPALLAATSEALTDAGFVVSARPDGRGFLDHVATFRPDVVVLDVMLPGEDGMGLARRLRAAVDVPVLFVTARDAVEDRLAGFDLGADDYVVKPFVLAELVARVTAVLRRAGRLTSPTVQVDDLTRGVHFERELLLLKIRTTASQLGRWPYITRCRKASLFGLSPSTCRPSASKLPEPPERSTSWEISALSTVHSG